MKAAAAILSLLLGACWFGAIDPTLWHREQLSMCRGTFGDPHLTCGMWDCLVRYVPLGEGAGGSNMEWKDCVLVQQAHP